MIFQIKNGNIKILELQNELYSNFSGFKPYV